VTSYTRLQRLPYPTPTRKATGTEYNERGNGALDLQRLAEAADRKFATLDAAWPNALQHPSKVIKLGTSITGMGNGSDHVITFDTTLATAGGLSGSENLDIQGSNLDAIGWYHIHFQVSSIPGGTANLGSRRQIHADVFHFSRGILEQYYNEELEPGSGHVCGNDLSFITYLDYDMIINLYMFHTNTSSTLTINTTATYGSMTRICPAV